MGLDFFHTHGSMCFRNFNIVEITLGEIIKPFSKVFLDNDSKSGKNKTAILSGIFHKESDLGC